MPTAQLFFGNDQRSGDQQLAGASPLAINVITDGAGAVRRRPGISAWSGFPSSGYPAKEVQGIFGYEGKAYVVYEDRSIFRISGGAATNLSTAGGTSFLAGTGRPVFADTAYRLVIAGGAAPEKIDLGEDVAERLGGSPPNATHVVGVDQRLVLNDPDTGNDNFRFSGRGLSGNETWDVLDFVIAGGSPDSLVALGERANRLFAFGTRSLQVYSPDATVAFATLAAFPRGCGAAHSIITADDDFAWLSERKTFLQGDGSALQVLSDPISQTLDSMTTTSDAFGFRWEADQFDVLAWKFPTDGRTFVLQQGGGWAQWQGWTDGQGHTPLPITAHHYWPEENLHLVGLETGVVAQFDSAANSDLGATIKAEVHTGFINNGTDAYKHCQAMKFTFKRGVGSATDPQVLLSWRDGLGDFCSPIRLQLGVAGDGVFTIEKRSLGTYRARQWKLEFTDAVDFVLARAEETFTVGGQN